MHIALVAGEASGDVLGAGLIQALRSHYPQARFTGLAGPRMIDAGCEPLPGYERLSVMGLVEVLQHLPGLLRLRRDLARHFLATRPDCFIGLDAPEFNLGLESKLRASGVPTVHYVSPTVWAWRPGRVSTVAKACDQLLCLFPFEPALFEGTGVEAVYVGHPLADRIPMEPDQAGARRELGLEPDAPVVALLPGSRLSEVQRLAAPLAGAAQLLTRRLPGVRFVAPLAKASLREPLQQALARHAPGAGVELLEGRSHTALTACDLALLASGTAALEALLFKRPMVVGYRLAPLTHFLLKGLGLLRLQRYALPNILAGRNLVPELMQTDCTATRLSDAALAWLENPQRIAGYRRECEGLHRQLRCNAIEAAARAVVSLIGGRRGVPHG